GGSRTRQTDVDRSCACCLTSPRLRQAKSPMGGASLPRHTPPGRAEPVAQLPHGLHVQPLALEDDLAAGLVLPVLEIARHVHPADRFLASPLVRLADDEIDVHGLVDPIIQMAWILHVEDLAAVTLARPQVGVATLELDVDPLAAGPAVVGLEFHLAINAVVELGQFAEDLVGL